MKSRYKAYIFDLDGTVLNTLDDICTSMNYAIRKLGYTNTFTPEEVKIFVGGGGTVGSVRAIARAKGWPLEELLLVGTPEDTITPQMDPAELARLGEVMGPYYAEHCNDTTAPYPGISEVILALRARGDLTAVVSNKPDPAVQTLVQDHFPGVFDFALGEKPSITRKPAPDMVWECMRHLGVEAEDAVYIGDSEVDIETAKNAGLDCILVEWGYRSRPYLEACGGEYFIQDAKQLLLPGCTF